MILYNELIEEVTERAMEKVRSSAEYNFTFTEALQQFLEDLEHDVLISNGSKTQPVTDEFLEDAKSDACQSVWNDCNYSWVD